MGYAGEVPLLLVTGLSPDNWCNALVSFRGNDTAGQTGNPLMIPFKKPYFYWGSILGDEYLKAKITGYHLDNWLPW